MKFVIEIGDVVDTGDSMGIDSLSMWHQGCGRVECKHDLVNPHYYLTCKHCGLDAVIADMGVTEIMRTAIDQAEERDISVYLVDNAQKCIVVPKGSIGSGKEISRSRPF
jgi:hypothetical protein